MKPISDGKLDMFEDVALEGAKRIKAYFQYEGDNLRYLQKAKVGATAISAYARMRASETNRMAIDFAVNKADALLQVPAPLKALKR